MKRFRADSVAQSPPGRVPAAVASAQQLHRQKRVAPWERRGGVDGGGLAPGRQKFSLLSASYIKLYQVQPFISIYNLI